MKTFPCLRLLTFGLLLGQPALARYREDDPGWSSALFKLAPPGALLAIGCITALIVVTAYAAKRSSGANAESFATLAVLLVLPLLALIVWYQPVLLFLPAVIAGSYHRVASIFATGPDGEESSSEDECLGS